MLGCTTEFDLKHSHATPAFLLDKETRGRGASEIQISPRRSLRVGNPLLLTLLCEWLLILLQWTDQGDPPERANSKAASTGQVHTFLQGTFVLADPIYRHFLSPFISLMSFHVISAFASNAPYISTDEGKKILRSLWIRPNERQAIFQVDQNDLRQFSRQLKWVLLKTMMWSQGHLVVVKLGVFWIWISAPSMFFHFRTEAGPWVSYGKMNDDSQGANLARAPGRQGCYTFWAQTVLVINGTGCNGELQLSRLMCSILCILVLHFNWVCLILLKYCCAAY